MNPLPPATLYYTEDDESAMRNMQKGIFVNLSARISISHEWTNSKLIARLNDSIVAPSDMFLLDNQTAPGIMGTHCVSKLVYEKGIDPSRIILFSSDSRRSLQDELKSCQKTDESSLSNITICEKTKEDYLVGLLLAGWAEGIPVTREELLQEFRVPLNGMGGVDYSHAEELRRASRAIFIGPEERIAFLQKFRPPSETTERPPLRER